MNREKEKKFDFSRSFFHIGQLYMYTFAANILLASVLFLIGQTVCWHLLPLSFLTAAGALAIFYDTKLDRTIAVEIILGIAVFAVLVLMVGPILDFSYDGNTYHKFSVGMLSNGWNPLYELPGEASKRLFNISVNDTWAESYCKATWIFGASVYSITGNIEHGKVYTLLGAFSTFCLIFNYLKLKNKGLFFSIIFSLAVACNPVALSQADTFYVDGFLHIMLFILVFFLSSLVNPEPVIDRRTSASLVAASMIVLGNIKFTGLFYGGVFCIVYFIWGCIQNHRKNEPMKKSLKTFALYAGLACVTVLWAGSSTYITNVIRHDSPFYPLIGSNSIDIITGLSPFPEVNHFKNLFLSLFSRQGKTAVLKIPLSFYLYEFGYMNQCDLLICGFGIFFSGILVVSIITLAYILIKMKKNERFYLLLVNLAACLALTFGITESWWARYAPYIYLIVLIALYLALDSKKKNVSLAGAILCSVLLFNNLLFLGHLPIELISSNEINANINELKSAEYAEVYSPEFSGLYFNLADRGFPYEINTELANDDSAIKIGYKHLCWKPLDKQELDNQKPDKQD